MTLIASLWLVSHWNKIQWGDFPTWLQGIAVAATLGYIARQFALSRDQVQDQRKVSTQQIDLLRAQVNEQREASTEQNALLRKQVDDQQAFITIQSEVLALQADALRAAKAEHDQEALDRHRAQAEQVLFKLNQQLLTNPGQQPSTVRYSVRIENKSDRLVSMVLVRWHNGSAPWLVDNSASDSVDQLWPEESEGYERDWTGPGNLGSIGATLEFEDANKVRWQKTKDGELTEFQSPDG